MERSAPLRWLLFCAVVVSLSSCCGGGYESSCASNGDCQGGYVCEQVCGASPVCMKSCASNADCSGMSTSYCGTFTCQSNCGTPSGSYCQPGCGAADAG